MKEMEEEQEEDGEEAGRFIQMVITSCAYQNRIGDAFLSGFFVTKIFL